MSVIFFVLNFLGVYSIPTIISCVMVYMHTDNDYLLTSNNTPAPGGFGCISASVFMCHVNKLIELHKLDMCATHRHCVD